MSHTCDQLSLTADKTTHKEGGGEGERGRGRGKGKGEGKGGGGGEKGEGEGEGKGKQVNISHTNPSLNSSKWKATSSFISCLQTNSLFRSSHFINCLLLKNVSKECA